MTSYKKKRINLLTKVHGLKADRYCSSRAFTLIELCVVVAVVGVLVALLFPAVGKMRDRTLSTECVGNLKQLSATCMVYSADNNGRMVPWRNAEGTWPEILAGLMDVTVGPDIEPKPFYCPINKRDFPESDGKKHGGYASNYAFNASVISEFEGGFQNPATRTSEIPNPSRTFLFADFLGSYQGAPALNTLAGITPTQGDCSLGFIHSGDINVAFVDGHVETIPKPIGKNVSMPFKYTKSPNPVWAGLR